MNTGLHYFLSTLKADTKQHLIRKAEGLATQIQQHLFLIFSVKDEFHSQYWENEVDTWLDTINNTNLKTGYSKRELYSSLLLTINLKKLKQICWAKKYLRNERKDTILIYDNWREALKFYPDILKEFAGIPLTEFVDITDLKSFKDAIKARGSAVSLYDKSSIIKGW